MSIYQTIFGIGDQHNRNCDGDNTKPCKCKSNPIRYQGSHIFPSHKDLRQGELSLGAIPTHITRDGKDEGPEGSWHPWLRLSLWNAGTVILTRAQVETLRDALTEWMVGVRP